MPNPEPHSIENAILSYLARNPEAAESLEGIVEWWLLDQDVQRTVRDVKCALGALEAQKRIVSELRQGKIIYRLPKQ